MRTSHGFDKPTALAIPAVLSAFSLALALLVPSPALAASLLDPIGPVLEAQSWHLIRVTLIGLFVVVPPLLLTAFVIWRYRIGGRSSSYWPTWEFNGFYETAIWTGPVIVVGFLGVWLVSSTLELDPYAPLPGGDPLRIDLIGLDDKWLAIYPDERVAALDEIAIPVDRPVSFRITSDTVMQSFLPEGFAGQIYLMPGMVTELNLAASEPGEGRAIQTQYNGAGFANQRVPMQAMTEGDFDAWVTGVSGDPLTARTYPRLISSAVGVREFEVVKAALMPLDDPCLFDRVVARYHQNKPISITEQPGSALYEPDAAPLPNGACDALLPEGSGSQGTAMGGMNHGAHAGEPKNGSE